MIRTSVLHSVALATSLLLVIGQPLAAGVKVVPIPTDGLILWLEATDAATLTLDNTGVTTVSGWRNKAPGFVNSVANAIKAQQPALISLGGVSALNFDGANDTLRDLAYNVIAPQMTVFLLVAPESNTGAYRAFLAGNDAGTNDYQTGINIDMTGTNSPTFSRFNVEGAKGGGGGGVDLKTSDHPFGAPHVAQVNYWDLQTRLLIDGAEEGTRSTNSGSSNLEQLRVGSRFYSGAESGYLDGSIVAIVVYDRVLNPCEARDVGLYVASIAGVPTAYDFKVAGDNDADDDVDFDDLNLTLANFSSTGVPGSLPGDADGDGDVDFDDLNQVLANFGNDCN